MSAWPVGRPFPEECRGFNSGTARGCSSSRPVLARLPAGARPGSRLRRVVQRWSARDTRACAYHDREAGCDHGDHSHGEEEDDFLDDVEGHVEAELDTEPLGLIVEDDFFEGSERLRAVFDARFAEPREVHGHRFVWDYWHVPGQYTHVRTSAEDYFPPALYAELVDALRDWGRERLGCTELTPLWLSYYVDGCEQALHCDNPHGPWALVLSLTRWDQRRFEGGETLLLRPSTLSWWGDFEAGRPREVGDLVEAVEARFNRLVVFDPRVPHGVARVQGTRDPREARLVIHGWFKEPSPLYGGDLDEATCGEALNQCTQAIESRLSDGPDVVGLLTWRLEVEPSGEVAGFELLTNTLQPRGASDPDDARAQVILDVGSALLEAQFPATPKGGHVIYPLVFE